MEATFKLVWKMIVIMFYIIAVYAFYYGVFTGLYCVFTYTFSSRHPNKSIGNFFRYYWSVLSMSGTYYAKGDKSKKNNSAWDEWYRDFNKKYGGTYEQARKQDVDPFVILGINEHTDYATAKLAYHKLVRAYHPDVTGGSDDGIKYINAAWDQVCQIKGWGKAHAQV